MLAYAEEVQPHLVGKDGGLNHVGQPLLRRNKVAGGGVGGALGKGKDADFKGWNRHEGLQNENNSSTQISQILQMNADFLCGHL